MFPVLSSFTVGRLVIGRPQKESSGGILELLPYRSLEFLVPVLLTVHSI